jgi:hypothetical protein
MKHFIFFFLLIPCIARASFIFHYGLNYSSEKDASAISDYEKTRMFNKIFLGASVDGNKTFFLGWNYNSWSSTLKRNAADEKYAMTEMGPKIVYFFGESRNAYLSAEWNPYANGSRQKVTTNNDVIGSSLGLGVGYRFKLSRLWGLGAGLHYHSLTLKKETIGSSDKTISDTVTNIMPMLELTFITR